MTAGTCTSRSIRAGTGLHLHSALAEVSGGARLETTIALHLYCPRHRRSSAAQSRSRSRCMVVHCQHMRRQPGLPGMSLHMRQLLTSSLRGLHGVRLCGAELCRPFRRSHQRLCETRWLPCALQVLRPQRGFLHRLARRLALSSRLDQGNILRPLLPCPICIPRAFQRTIAIAATR